MSTRTCRSARSSDAKEPAPLPERSQLKRWTYQVVRHLLGNRRYRGTWQYGDTEAVWQNKADYSWQNKRERPLLEVELPDLRLVDERTWAEAQRRLADYLRRAGRKPKDGGQNRQPKLLNRLCVCEKHKRALIAGGNGNRYMFCPDCLADPERRLVSLLPRVLGTKLLWSRLAALVRADVGGLAEQAVASCRRQAEALQRPDPADLEDKRRQAERLTQQIRTTMRAPTHGERDEAENQQLIAELRRERMVVEADVLRLELLAKRRIEIPTVEAVRTLLEQLGDVLFEAAVSGDDRRVAAARRVVEAMTGGQIVISQMEEPVPKRSWLRGTFELRLLRPLCDQLGVAALDDKPLAEHVDFRKPTPAERLAAEAKALWDEGLLVKQIAQRLSVAHGKRIGRAMLNKALVLWFAARGMPLQDGRSRRKSLASKGVDPNLSARIADDVMALDAEGMLYVEIAERLRVDRNTVTAAVRVWHESRRLPEPDGRTRRKGLEAKSRTPMGGDRDAA